MRTKLAAFGAVPLALILAVTACSPDSDADSSSSPPSPEPEAVETEDEAEAEAPGDEFTVENGVLQPLVDGFPSHSITLLNRTEVGDAADIFLRAIAPIAARLAPVEVDVRVQPLSSALGHFAFDAWADGQADGDQGYYMHHASWPAVPLRYLQVELGPGNHYSKIKPVTMLSAQNFAVGVPVDSEFESIDDVVTWAEANPGELSVAVLSQSQLEFAVRLWSQEAGIDVRLVPASSPVESVQIMLGGGAQVALSTAEPLVNQVQAGDARILMQVGSERVSTMADIPTSTEIGWDIPLGTKDGLATHSEAPDEHVRWLAELFRLVSEDPEFDEYLETHGKSREVMAPDEITALLDQIHDNLRPLVEELGILAEGND